MGDHETIEDLKEQLASQARLFDKRLSAIEASRENTGGLQAAPTGGDQPSSGVEGAGTSEQAGFASCRRFRVTTDSLLQTIGDDVDISGGSSLSNEPRETSSIKSAVPKFNGSGMDYPLWKRRFEGYAITSGCMQESFYGSPPQHFFNEIAGFRNLLPAVSLETRRPLPPRHRSMVLCCTQESMWRFSCSYHIIRPRVEQSRNVC